MNLAVHIHTPTLSVVDPRGLAVRTVKYCRAIAVEVAQAQVHHTAYDATGRAVAQRDPRLYALHQADPSVPANVRTVYSLSGQILAQDSVDPGAQLNLYDVAGQVIQAWDGAQGPQRQMTYDALLRPLEVRERMFGAPQRCVERFTYAGADPAEAAHNRCGRLVRRDDPAGTRTWPAYGLLDSPLQEDRRFLTSLDPPDWPEVLVARDALLEPAVFATAWRYAALGAAIEQTDAQGHRQGFTFDVAGQVCRVTLTLAKDMHLQVLQQGLTYDAQGRKLTQTAGNSVVSAFEYDLASGRLSRQRAAKADRTILQDLHYTYDLVGNVASIKDRTQVVRYACNRCINGLRTYRYDSLDQLIHATGVESTTARIGPALPGLTPLPLDPAILRPYTQRYTYDTGGNLVELGHHCGETGYTRTMAVARTSNRALQREVDVPLDVEAGFDSHGNLKRLSPGGQALTWNARHQLAQVTAMHRAEGEDDTERYVYDGEGQRVRKILTTRAHAITRTREVRYLPGLEWHTDSRDEALVVIVASGARVLHWTDGQPAKVPNDQVRYTLTDPLGSTTLELDQAAALISAETYYPYGGTAARAGRHAVEADYKTIRYSGKERDATGLYYYGFRYYAPWLQRWLNPDPAGDADGLNRYRFARNSPIRFRDDTGLMPTPRPAEEQSITRSDIIKSTHPYKALQQELINRIAAGEKPAIMLIDMQPIPTPAARRGLLAKSTTVRTNKETEKRQLEILKFAKRHELPVIDVNYVYSSFADRRPYGKEMVNQIKASRTYKPIRKELKKMPIPVERMLKKAESVVGHTIELSPDELAALPGVQPLSWDRFEAKYPNNSIVLMGQLEDVCIRMTAQDLVAKNRTVLISEDLVVNQEKQNIVTGISKPTGSSGWEYVLSKAKGGSQEYPGAFRFFVRSTPAIDRLPEFE